MRSHGSEATHASLLSRVRDPADHAAWREFESRYRDLLLNFCRRRGVQHVDAEDVVQGVMANLARALPRFKYDRRRGRFRDYLYRCTRNAIARLRSRPRGGAGPLFISADQMADQGEDLADGAEGTRAWEEEWVAHHYRLAMRTVRETFEARSVEIFDRSVAGARVADLAAEYGMSEQAVHKVRQRIRARMEALIAQQVREEDECG